MLVYTHGEKQQTFNVIFASKSPRTKLELLLRVLGWGLSFCFPVPLLSAAFLLGFEEGFCSCSFIARIYKNSFETEALIFHAVVEDNLMEALCDGELRILTRK